MLKDIVFPLPEPCNLQHWQEKLENELPFNLIRVDAPQHQCVHYYDSFDWLCFQADETIEWHEDGPDSCLQLRQGKNGPVAEQSALVTAPPRFPTELADCRLRKHLGKRLGYRAMLRMVSIETTSQRLRLVDSDLKSLAYLVLSQHRIISSPEQSSVMRNEIRVQPLRKHENSADKLAWHIEKKWGLQRDETSLLEQALASQGKQAATYSGKLAVPLEAELRADASMRKILLVLLATMEINEQGTIDELDSEFLHDFRIAVRRTRSALNQVKSVFPEHSRARFAKSFAWLGDITTPTRDLDVHLLEFDALQKSLPRDQRDDLEPLRQFLTVEQQQAHNTLARHLKSAAYRRIKEQWKRFLTTPLAKHPVAKDALTPTGQVANQRIWRMYRRALKEGRAITPASPAADLHELRKSCKKLRYLMEFFQSLYPADEIRCLIRELKGLQDNLGAFQDLEVQMQTLGLYAEQMQRDGILQSGTQTAFNTLQDQFHISTERVRNEFESRFERFSSKPNRRRFKSLFHGDRAR